MSLLKSIGGHELDSEDLVENVMLAFAVVYNCLPLLLIMPVQHHDPLVGFVNGPGFGH